MLLTNTPLEHADFQGKPCFHFSVTEIDVCSDYQDAKFAEQAEAEAELAAEAAAERYLEDAGYWSSREQDDVEAARGVIQFDDAYALARSEVEADELARQEAEVLLAQYRFEGAPGSSATP